MPTAPRTIEELLDRTAIPIPPELRERVLEVSRSLAVFNEVEIRPGDRLGPFEIVEFLGQGGLGRVYRARDASTGEVVAIKIPRRSLASRLLNEGHLGARLGGPEIVRIERIGSHEQLPYLVLEYCPGGSLAERLALAPDGLPLADVFAISRAILGALRTAHEADIVHLDVKPSNVLFDAQGRAKLADFGIGKRGLAGRLLEEESEEAFLADHGTLWFGSPGYMPPEQEYEKLRTRGIGPGADLYAFGVVLFQMLTGRGPDRLELPSRSRGGVPREFDSLIERLTSIDPRRRPASAAEVQRELEAIERLSDGSRLGTVLGAALALLAAAATADATGARDLEALLSAGGFLVLTIGLAIRSRGRRSTGLPLWLWMVLLPALYVETAVFLPARLAPGGADRIWSVTSIATAVLVWRIAGRALRVQGSSVLGWLGAVVLLGTWSAAVRYDPGTAIASGACSAIVLGIAWVRSAVVRHFGLEGEWR